MSSGAVLYVYFKVDPAQHAALAPRVRAFQAALQTQWPGLVCELLQRPEAAKGVETWMETYRLKASPDGGQDAALSDELIAAIEAAARAADLPAPRHTERFIPLR